MSIRALFCFGFAAIFAVNEAKKVSLNEQFNSATSQTPQDPIIGNWTNLTAKDNLTSVVGFSSGTFSGSWLAPSRRSTSTFACSTNTPGPSAYACYFYDLGVMFANISSSSSGWQLRWSDSSVWAYQAPSPNVSQVQANMTLTGVSLASLTSAQQTSLRNSVGAAIASEAGVTPNAVIVTLSSGSFLLLSQLESQSSQTGSILVRATITVPSGSATSLSRSLSSSSALPSSVSSSVRSTTGYTVTASAATTAVVTPVASSTFAPIAASSTLGGPWINWGTPLKITLTLDLGDNTWLVGLNDNGLYKISKIQITGKDTYRWISTFYNNCDTQPCTTGCSLQANFNLQCFRGTAQPTEVYPLTLKTSQVR